MMIGDATTAGIHAALHGLDTRRAAHEANLANIETPGYKARSVQFESQLQDAMERGSTDIDPDVEVSRAPGRANGNNVNVEHEMVSLTQTALAQELLIRAMNDKYGLIRTAVGPF